MSYASALNDCMISLAPSALPLPLAYSCFPLIIQSKDLYPWALPPLDTSILSFVAEYCLCELFVFRVVYCSNLLASHGSSASMFSSNVEILMLTLHCLSCVALVLSCTVWFSTNTRIADFGKVFLVVVLLVLYNLPLGCSSIACAVWCSKELLLSLGYHSQLCLDCCGLTIHGPSGCRSLVVFPSTLKYFFRALLHASGWGFCST